MTLESRLENLCDCRVVFPKYQIKSHYLKGLNISSISINNVKVWVLSCDVRVFVAATNCPVLVAFSGRSSSVLSRHVSVPDDPEVFYTEDTPTEGGAFLANIGTDLSGSFESDYS